MKAIAFVVAVTLVGMGAYFFYRPPQEEPKRILFSKAEDRWLDSLSDSEKFRLLDQFSISHALSDYTDKTSVILTSVSKYCLERRPDLIEKISAKPGAVSLLITSDPEEVYADYAHMKTPVLFDLWKFVSRRLDLREFGDFVELKPDGHVASRGNWLGQNMETKECANDFSREEIVFYKDVLPVFSRECLRCHIREDDIDYFKTMAQVKKWSKMMMRTMEVLRMPPGGLDPHVYSIENRGPLKDLGPLHAWLDRGAAFTETDDSELSRARKELIEKKDKSDLEGRSPDYTFEMVGSHTVPSQGVLYFDRAVLIDSFPEDALIEGVQFYQNQKVVHHSNLYVLKKAVAPEDLQAEIFQKKSMDHIDRHSPSVPIKVLVNGKIRKGKRVETASVFNIGSWTENRYNEGGAFFVPKGSQLVIQNHYQPNGKEETNRTLVRLFKYKGEKPAEILHRYLVKPPSFVIPPHESHFVIESFVPIEEEITLLSFFHHMHYRGKSLKLFITKPNQAEQLVTSIPFYQLKFADRVAFREPIFLPKGSQLRLVVVYDNSAQNIANPDPQMRVKMGGSTYQNEMHTTRFTFIKGAMTKALR